MKVEANIDEADIGSIKTGQPVEFTVDAFPDEIFTGKVAEVRLNPVTTSNVVTYIVIINAPNPEKKLMPGMTASIEIVTNEAKNVQLVAAEALQFSPTQTELATYIEQLTEKEKAEMEQIVTDYFSRILDKNNKQSYVWVKSGNIIKPVAVQSGIDNGIFVQIVKGNISVGNELVTNFTEQEITTTDSNGSSPFMPTPPKH